MLKHLEHHKTHKEEVYWDLFLSTDCVWNIFHSDKYVVSYTCVFELNVC
jgi:hypothetical protein